MKKLTLTLTTLQLALHACAAGICVWPRLPEASEAHTEVSTNVTLGVNLDRLMAYQLKLEAVNITSNEVIVAVGSDSNGDGDLSLDEAAFAFCYDCGVRSIVNYLTKEVTVIGADTIAIRRRDFDPAWNLAKIIKRGPGEVEETITETVENLKFEIRLR